MPALSIRFIRASLLYLLVGFLLGALILAEKGISYYPPIWATFPIHMEFLLFGWLLQLALGVGFWIFPRFGSGSIRGNEKLIGISFWALNVGILITSIQAWASIALIIGRLMEAAAIIAYIVGSWSRIKPLGLVNPKQ